MDPVAVVGAAAPGFILHDLNGKAFRLADQRGKVLVLKFWSADCPRCERTDEMLASLRSVWGDRVQVWRIAPSANEDDGSLKRAALQHRADIVMRDAGPSIADRHGAQTTPHLFVIDEQGILRYAGAPDDVSFRQRVATRNYLAEAIGALLRGVSPRSELNRPLRLYDRAPACRRTSGYASVRSPYSSGSVCSRSRRARITPAFRIPAPTDRVS